MLVALLLWQVQGTSLRASNEGWGPPVASEKVRGLVRWPRAWWRLVQKSVGRERLRGSWTTTWTTMRGKRRAGRRLGGHSKASKDHLRHPRSWVLVQKACIDRLSGHGC